MNDTIYILILVVMGLAIAYTTSRSSNKREKLHGGTPSLVLNYLASGLLAMLAPTVLCNVIFIHPNFLAPILPFLHEGSFFFTLAHLLVIVLVMVGLALLLLMPLAAIEKPFLDKLARQEDKGWTKEDAETSGL
jgi:uncharacterized membrane protein